MYSHNIIDNLIMGMQNRLEERRAKKDVTKFLIYATLCNL